MTSELDAKYQYEMKFNIFIDSLLNAPGNTDEMNTLLFQKKIASNIELNTVKTNREALIKQQDETNVTRELFSRIAMLPHDIKMYIGSFSHAVINQKRLVKIEFYNNWINSNKARIVGLIKYWTKKDLALILDNINYVHNSYYNKLKAGTSLYKNSVPLILRSKIELLIDAKGRRSNIEMYGLLLSIEKYHAKKYTK
jgi:hypothetical protein